MPQDALSFTLNHAQWRIDNERIATLVSGQTEPDSELRKPVQGWDYRWGSVDGNGDMLTWVEPVRNVLMLKPAPLLQAWQSVGTGIYARLQKSDFTLDNAAKWLNTNKLAFAADYWLHGVTLSDEGGITTSTWAKNRGFFVEGLVYSTGRERNEIHFGWNSDVTGASGVSLRAYSDGDIEVWKNGQLIETGNVGSRLGAKQGVDGRSMGLLCIPYRKRELLVYSSLGGGFSTVFPDIDEEDPDPTITDATNFWFFVPGSNRTMTLQIAPIQYPSSAYRAGIPSVFAEAPAVGETPEITSYFNLPGFGSAGVTAALYTEADPTVAFVPNGVQTRCRVRVDLTSDNAASPFVEGVQAAFPTQRLQTDDSEEQVLDESILSARVSTGEDPSSVRLDLTLREPSAWDEDEVLRNQSNAPLKVSLGESVVLDMFTDPVRLIEAHGDENRRVMLSARDRWKSLEQFRFRDPTPLDGLSLREAFLLIARAAGIEESETDVEDADFTLPIAGTGACGDWSVLIRAGDTAAEWLLRLRDSFAGNWFLGFVPGADGPLLRFKSPEEMGDEPLVTLYMTDEEAASEGVTEEDRRKFVIRAFEEDSLEPEVNAVHVIGLDPASFRPIAAKKTDFASQDPSTPPLLRPDNWLGEPRLYGYIEPYLSSMAAVERCAELLYSRLTKRRYLCEFECEMLIDEATLLPIWRGDVVEISTLRLWPELEEEEDPPEFETEKWRIVSVRFETDREPTEDVDFVWRTAHYVAEKIVEETAQGCAGNAIGTALQEMRSWRPVQIHERTVIQRGGERLEQMPTSRSSVL